MKIGVDLSKYQGLNGAPISLIVAAGASFVILRAGLGLEVDVAFDENVKSLAATNADGGYYWYVWPHIDPAAQAVKFFETIKDHLRPNDHVAVDIEEPGVTLHDVFAFGRKLRTLIGEQRQMSLYTNYSVWRNYGNPDATGIFDDLWLAYYTLRHQPLKTADVSSVSFSVRGLAGFRRATIVQFGPLLVGGRPYDGDVYDDSLGSWRANLGDGRAAKPLIERPNYRKAYNASVNFVTQTLASIAVPDLHGPAVDKGVADAKADIAAALTELLVQDPPTA